jgi:uncharacterized membrane protein YqiK
MKTTHSTSLILAQEVQAKPDITMPEITQGSIGAFNGILVPGLVGIALIALFLLSSTMLLRFYKRSSKELSFVRTGFGGQKVIVNSSDWVLPVLHDVTVVNMNTLKLEIYRGNEQSLITRDRLRINVQVDFYVRVKLESEAIALAAQTLGQKTTNSIELKNLLEGKFVSALRAVAAGMNMEELHEQRIKFMQEVQKAVTEDLSKNGLELETLSLTSLDQTSPEYFSPQNAFDMQGLTKLTQEIEIRRKERNEIEQDTELQIQTKNQDTEIQIQMKSLETERQKLNLQKEEEIARLEQESQMSALRIQITREREEKQQETERRKIEFQQQLNMAKIQSEQALAEERIRKDAYVRELEVEKHKVLELAEIERKKVLDLSQQDLAIAIAEKSTAQARAEAIAYQAKAEVVQVEERLITVREQERADREKTIELIEATKEAEKEAIQLTTVVEAERRASVDQSETKRILAQGEADAEKLRAEAEKVRYEIEANGRRSLHEADNILSDEQISLQIKLAIVKYLPEIIRESVKPMERIEGIRIYQVEGLGNNPASNSFNGGDSSVMRTGNLADEVVSSALRYRAHGSLIDFLLQELGLNGHSVESFAKPLFEKSLDSDANNR